MIFGLDLKKTPKLCIKFINQSVSIKARVHLENYHYLIKIIINWFLNDVLFIINSNDEPSIVV